MRWTSSSLERKRPQLTKSGDFTKYLENGSQAKVVGEMAMLRQLSLRNTPNPSAFIDLPARRA